MPIVSKLSEKKLTAIIEPSGGGFVISCPELDLATQGKTEDEALNDLIEMVIDYAQQYSEKMKEFSRSPNRSSHLPYIKIINKLTPDQVRNLFF
jgi:predicted RNase H-like HicB family nuclease